MRKILSVWIPYELTNDNKKKRVECCTEDLHLNQNFKGMRRIKDFIATDNKKFNSLNGVITVGFNNMLTMIEKVHHFSMQLVFTDVL